MSQTSLIRNYGYKLIEVDNCHQTEKYLNVAFYDNYGTIWEVDLYKVVITL